MKTRIIAFLFLMLPISAHAQLKVCPDNQRYFCKDGSPVLLTGSHTWNDLYDLGPTNPPAVLNYTAFLDFMTAHNHNFLRLWAAEQTRWWGKYVAGPYIYPRTGPGLACDGQLKFDVSQFDQDYFYRLRSRVIEAGSRGIYTSVMLFMPDNAGNASEWCTHPFAASANINGIDGDLNGDGKGAEVWTLASPDISGLQQAYIHKVIDSVNDLENVLFEVGNEADPGTATNQWQYAVIDEVHQYEAALPLQHPVGMTSPFPFNNAALDASPSDWVSYGNSSYGTAPPLCTGTKVCILDTDHISPTFSYGSIWPWKAFLKGNNPIRMDPFGGLVGFTPRPEDEPFRLAMGDTLAYARRMNLLTAVPGGCFSSGYALCSPELYIGLAFSSNKKKPAQVSVTMAAGTYAVEWFNPNSRQTVAGSNVTGGASRSFTSPFGNNVSAVLSLELNGTPPDPPDPPQPLKRVTDSAGHVWEMWPASPYNRLFLDGSSFANCTDLALGSDGVAYSKGTTDNYWWWWDFSTSSWKSVVTIPS
jgi:hypothetical protein